MKKLLILAGAILLLSSCGTSSKTLYDWGGMVNGTDAYDYYSYKSYKNNSGQDLCDLICTYEKMISKPGGTRQTPPPGICAEYGYILLQPQTAEIFAQYATKSQKKLFGGDDNFAAVFYEKGCQLLQKETELYPESQVFLAPLIKRWRTR